MPGVCGGPRAQAADDARPLRLLFDQNLSSRLVRLLADIYPGSVHVRGLGLHESDDEVIWQYAGAHKFIIVSKDSDFHQLSFLRGYPPKVVWLRIGNAPTAVVAAVLRDHQTTILDFHSAADIAFLALA